MRAEILRIETAEWHHRGLVAAALIELGAAPRPRRERLMWSIGRCFGALCFVSPRFGPMYAAGRLEAMNVGQYADALAHAETLGLSTLAGQLRVMVAEEYRHEHSSAASVAGACSCHSRSGSAAGGHPTPTRLRRSPRDQMQTLRRVTRRVGPR